jgi:hypothetical protein
MNGRSLAAIVFLVAIFAIAGAWDPGTPGYPHVWQGDDWISSQWMYLLVVPITGVGVVAWLLGSRTDV